MKQRLIMPYWAINSLAENTLKKDKTKRMRLWAHIKELIVTHLDIRPINYF